MHIIACRLSTTHAQEWAKVTSTITLIIEQVQFSLHEPSVLKEIYLDPHNGTLAIDNRHYHMVIEIEDKFHDKIWFWE